MSTPTAVFGVPLYNEVRNLPEALESLLAQTYQDFAVVLVDDSTDPEPGAIVRRYAERDRRITYVRNPQRLGMVGNWRHAFDVAREHFPDSPYFAWASDHDSWHPYWLAAMIDGIESAPGIVVAYPRVTHLEKETRYRRAEGAADTFGLTERAARLETCCLKIAAGSVVYGLFRTAALERAGVFRPVLLPDRLLLAELSLYGQFKQLPEYLWMRRRTARFSLARQRRTLFVGRRPAHIYFPWPLVHAAVLTNELVLSGRAVPEIGRLEGCNLVLRYVAYGLIREVQRQVRLARLRATHVRDDLRRTNRRLQRGAARLRALLRPTTAGEEPGLGQGAPAE